MARLLFYMDREELLDALKCFAPFIKPQKKRNPEDCCDEDGIITLPEPYYEDKVTFVFQKGYLYLYIYVDGIKYEKLISGRNIEEDQTFCLPFTYLQQEVERHKCKYLEFTEIWFFGFTVFDPDAKKHLFDIEAFSAYFQETPSTKFRTNLSPQTFSLERFMVLKALVSLDQYTQIDPLYKYKRHIWFLIDNGYCNIFATNGSVLRLERFPVSIKEFHAFSIPGAYAVRIYNVLSKWKHRPEFNIAYDGLYCCINDTSFESKCNESFEFPMNLKLMPNVQKVLDERKVNHKAIIKANDLRTTLSIIRAMQGMSEKMIMHFKCNHVNIYWKDPIGNKRVIEYKDVVDCDEDIVIAEDFVVALHFKQLEQFLHEIKTENVILYFIGDNKLDVLNENETLLGDTVRIMCTSLMDEDDKKLLKEGDETLENDKRYVEKYCQEDEYDEVDDADIYATNDEMREEAVSRMKAMSLYPEIIKYFEVEGEPQVYEPPYGASYALEEEELEELHQIEADRNFLVWGVIRYFGKLYGSDVTINYYLFVSNLKTEWEHERQLLYERTPCVYTTMEEYTTKDYEVIDIYYSEGGTLLRKWEP